MGDQALEIRDYDPAWIDRFVDQRDHLSVLLESWLSAPVAHVGSTAVPGLRAKPIVDMLAPVVSLADARDAVAVLADDGWLFWPDDPCRHYRLWFLRPRPQARTHHLQIIEHGHPHARALLTFRDEMRADPRLRDRYVQLKERLVARHRTDRNAYTNAKAEFVAQVLRDAGAEVPPREHLP